MTSLGSLDDDSGGSDKQLSSWLGDAVAYSKRGEYERARRAASSALVMLPGSKLCLGLVAAASFDRFDPESLIGFRRASVADPHDPVGYYNLASAAMQLGDAILAVKQLSFALTLAPSYVTALTLQGSAHRERALWSQAEIFYSRARAIDPGCAKALSNLGQLMIMRGEFSMGWKLFESRLDLTTNVFQSSKPRPSSSFSGGSLFIWGEQGIGDEIMFSSLLHEVVPRFSDVTLQLDRRLHGFIERSFPEVNLIDYSASPEENFDSQMPIGSLGLYLRNSGASFKGNKKFFFLPDMQRVYTAEKFLRKKPNDLVIGVSWASASPESGRVRSLPIKALIEGLNISRARFINLQYGIVTVPETTNPKLDCSQLETMPNCDLFWDLEGVAALISRCDIVVTIGNVTAHLAGALGIPTAVLLPAAAGWRWMRAGDRTPWYPTVRLYRQSRIGDWPSVVSCLKSDIVSGRFAAS